MYLYKWLLLNLVCERDPMLPLDLDQVPIPISLVKLFVILALPYRRNAKLLLGELCLPC